MPNDLTVIQNTVVQKTRIGASRQTYSDVKNLVGLNLAMILSNAVLSVLIFLNLVDKSVGIFCGGMVFVIEFFALQPIASRKKELAAKIQEDFDCDVLGMEWSKQRVGSHVDHAEVALAYARYQRRDHAKWPLENWYAPATLGTIPIVAARVICQKTNCYWSESQSNTYMRMLITLAICFFVPYTVYAIGKDIRVREYFSWMAPLVPGLIFCAKQWREHKEASTKMAKIKDETKALLTHIMQGDDDQNEKFSTRARSIQNDIFDARKKNPPIFDFLFRLTRNAYEAATSASAGKDVEDYLSSNHAKGRVQLVDLQMRP